MGASNEFHSFPKTFPSCKVLTVESNLQQTLSNFKELVIEIEELHSENKNYRSMYLSQKEKCESQTCDSCEELKKHISLKEQILESVVSALNKLSDTRDFNVLDTIFKIINGDINLLTLPKDPVDDIVKEQSIISPKKEVSVHHDISQDESVAEIEGTPIRKSPIIHSKKLKTNTTYSLSLKDKKKCPESWPTPENKSIKLSYPTPTRNKTSRLKQSRLNLVKVKTSSIVDLTCSPETGRSYNEIIKQCNIKKDVLDNDDTILPSPTSDHVVQLPSIYKSISKESPVKFKKPALSMKFKLEVTNNVENEKEETIVKEVEDSINLLKRFPKAFKSPLKKDKVIDETHIPDESISLLQHVIKIEERNNKSAYSPKKRPLVENMNLINTQNLPESQCSVSLLRQDVIHTEAKNEPDIRIRSNIEPVYKEQLPRRKMERRALPGWSCEECKNFYDELYRDDLDMLAKKMDECSKHRGRNNPIRPKTPDGFWNPRWEVPNDTEEFNLRNNAL